MSVFSYDDKDDILNANTMADYIISRINKNEKCFFISGDIDMQLIIKRLKAFIDFDGSINRGQLTFLDKNDAYSKDGKFKPEKMIALLKKLTDEAIQNGYKGFSITGEISWVLDYDDGFERIMDYENMLNSEIFGFYPVSAICRYNINKFSSNMIKNIIEVHPIVIWENEVHENPFYFELSNTENLDVEKFQVISMLAAIIKYTKIKSRFHDEIESAEKKYRKLQLKQLENIVFTLVELLEIHDKYTRKHSVTVAEFSKRIAKKMQLSEDIIDQIYYAGIVHDIGKTVISKEVINKKGKLTKDEFEIIKKHPIDGCKALKKVEGLSHIANIVLQHHERWDGTGYPCNLNGENIHLESRIIAIADAYDAMTSDRPYRKAFSKEEAIDEIRINAGKQFDPDIAIIAIEKVFKNM
ncbi:MEDS domain-containing protein [Clostridiaceae bacterium HSG29]|nr:MEDS domain-containing protein [Clostridiaceae bacterium HSG29]